MNDGEKDQAGLLAELGELRRRVAELEAENGARQQAQEELRLFKTIVESSHEAIAVIQDEQIKYANQALAEIIGYSMEEMTGWESVELAQLVHPDDLALVTRRARKKQQGNHDALVRHAYRLITQSGEIKWVDQYSKTIRYAGRPADFVTLVDVTERKQAEEQLQRYATELERSNRELEQFAYVASHDLQEPLRMVASFLEALRQDFGSQLDPQAQEYVDYALDGAKRMREMILALLAYSRVSTRGREFAPVDCELVLEDVLWDLQVMIKENDARISHDPLPTVMADTVQLEQVFQNLISNAIKFRRDGPPHVHISAEFIPLAPPSLAGRAGGKRPEWLFSVRDNGIGINQAQAECVFQIFQRLHTRDQYPGAGIGLALCKKIIERHGGRIWLESQPGQGTTFYFTLKGQA